MIVTRGTRSRNEEPRSFPGLKNFSFSFCQDDQIGHSAAFRPRDDQIGRRSKVVTDELVVVCIAWVSERMKGFLRNGTPFLGNEECSWSEERKFWESLEGDNSYFLGIPSILFCL